MTALTSPSLFISAPSIAQYAALAAYKNDHKNYIKEQKYYFSLNDFSNVLLKKNFINKDVQKIVFSLRDAKIKVTGNISFIIIDEAQNLTMHEIKTIITRVGDGTKVVLTGDIEQIDNIYVNETSNGLAHAVEKFKEFPLAGHVTFKKGERSEVATLASKVL